MNKEITIHYGMKGKKYFGFINTKDFKYLTFYGKQPAEVVLKIKRFLLAVSYAQNQHKALNDANKSQPTDNKE